MWVKTQALQKALKNIGCCANSIKTVKDDVNYDVTDGVKVTFKSWILDNQ